MKWILIIIVESSVSIPNIFTGGVYASSFKIHRIDSVSFLRAESEKECLSLKEAIKALKPNAEMKCEKIKQLPQWGKE